VNAQDNSGEGISVPAQQPVSKTIEFVIGSEVACRDGVGGELRRVVVDPVARAITHLVVEPRHRRGTGRLVPVDLVVSTDQGIQLRCTTAQLRSLDDAEEVQLLPGASGDWMYPQEQMMSLPHLGLGIGGPGGVGAGGHIGVGSGPRVMMFDRVPEGEVQVCRGDRVHTTDGAIGRVQGLLVDPSDDHVTHVLLDEGHLWGAKRVAIPISAVTRVDDGVRLSLTKDQVRDLPPVPE
jgi:sporulation protein YlmC with PRC-barrel domain